MLQRVARGLVVVLAIQSGVLATPAAAADVASDSDVAAKEMRARQAFASGQYEEAINLFAKLYAETLHPTYLRNIGRAYQNMEVPDKAIASFRDYLRKAPNLPPADKQEVEGFIAEMEQLKARQASAPVPTAPEPKQTQGDPVLVGGTGEAPAGEGASLTSRWWFWALVGGVVVAGTVGALAAGGVFTTTEDAPCQTPAICLR